MQYDTGAVRLDNIKFFFFLVMTLSLPFSESIKTICLLTSSVFLLIQVLRREANIRFSMLHYGFIFLFLASVISSIFATEPSKSWSGSKDILFYSITFFIACSIDNEKKIQILLWGLYISTVLAALSGIFNSMTAHKPLEIHSLGNQNYTAMFFMIILTSMISTILFSDKKASLRRYILIIFSIITLLASAMTLMRASFLGLFAFILSLLNLKKPSRAILIFIIGFVFLTILVLYSDRAMWQKLFTFQSMISRLDIWRGATSIFLENPLTGVGLNHFNFRFPPNHPVEPNNTVYDAHSLYFQIASQMGLFGIISLIIIFFGFIKGWSRLQGSTGFSKALKYSSLGAFLVIAITGLFDTTLHHEHAMAFSLISGLTFGYYQRKNETL